jgi:pimeloyl-ACP methyl ester carboxylesterase
MPLRHTCQSVWWLPLALMLAGCLGPPYPSGSLEQLYPDAPRPALATLQGVDGPLHYAQLHQTGQPPVLFIHGAPGDWKAWARYLDAPDLRGLGPLTAADRPGYGGSGAGRMQPDLDAQAQALLPLLPTAARSILVGHSLGGAIAARLAIDQPQRVCGAVLVAPSIAPELEAPRWYNRLADQRWLQPLIPRTLLDSNAEIAALQANLRRLQADWPLLQRPLIVVQGMDDRLVDPRTADYAEQQLPAAWREVQRHEDEGHFLLWQRPALVLAAIQQLARGCR